MKTVCQGCVFAELKLGTQTGCQLGKLEKYKDASQAVFNPDTGFYEIETFCKTVRTEIWAAKQTEDLIEAIRKESANKFSVIIVANEFNLDKLENTISSLTKSTLKPIEIILVVTTLTHLKSEQKLFAISQLVDSKISYQYIELFSDISPIDEAFGKLKGNYYTWLICGNVLDSNVLHKANEAINDIPKQYLWLDTPEPIISSFLHRLLDGNKEESLRSKLDSIPHFKAKHYLNETDFNNNY